MSDTTISKAIFLPATPEVVWTYLTEQDKLGQWFYPSSADLTEGQDYELVQAQEDGSNKKLCWGKVVSMDKPNNMEWTFTITPLAGAMTTVRWTLAAIPGGTRLTLTHEGVGDGGESAVGLLMALDEGWDKHFLTLRSAVASEVS